MAQQDAAHSPEPTAEVGVSRLTRRARLEASLAAYRAALTWLRAYPAADVDRRLVDKIAIVEQDLAPPVPARAHA